jgi:hypothetical protein
LGVRQCTQGRSTLAGGEQYSRKTAWTEHRGTVRYLKVRAGVTLVLCKSRALAREYESVAGQCSFERGDPVFVEAD